MTVHRTTPDAAKLLFEGQLAMSQIEANGVRVDKGYLDSTVVRVEKQIAGLERDLQHHKVYGEWKRVYGDKLDFESRDQLAHVLFEVMGYQSGGSTTKGRRASTNKAILELIDDPFVKDYLKIAPLKKSLATNLLGLRREIVRHTDGDWYVHPINNLNTTATFRPSSDRPNWKNYPKRNPEIAGLVRPSFVPRRGDRHFVDIDQAQIEVRVPACDELAADPELIRYINDKSSDMHRDQACNVWLLPKDQITKAVRQTTKTNFVFAGFYGSPYYNTAKRLWDDVDRYQLKTVGGVPMKEHLASVGITSRGACDAGEEPTAGTFEAHVRDCEKKLWGQYHVYKDWKRKQVESYHRDCSLLMVTGFAVSGPRSATQIPNYKIQGPAYHITLWSIVELLKLHAKYKADVFVLGEIYDSMQFDAASSELDDLLCDCRYVMTEAVRKHWGWITIPLEVEMEVAPVGGSWHECKEWVDDGTLWVPKKKG